MKRLFLVDISSLIFRAFYAVRPLTSPQGLPTNAVYGVLSMLVKLIKDENPDYIVICYDLKEPSFRKELYTEYKANRAEMPEELVPQMPVIKELIERMGLPSVSQVGFEADDLIGTLAKSGAQKKFEVSIVSGDKDFCQLIGDNMYLYDTMKNEKMGRAEIIDKWGVAPEKFLDFLALVGDSSDNVPGVSGIGPKGAQALLKQFHSLEAIYENLSSIKSESIRNKLAAGKEMAFLSRRLVTIVTDVPIDCEIANYERRPIDQVGLLGLLSELNFKSFEKALHEGNLFVRTGAPAKPPIMRVNTATALVELSQATPLPAAQTFPQLPTSALTVENLATTLKQGQLLWYFFGERGLCLSCGTQIYEIQGDPHMIGPITDQREVRWQGHDLKTFWHQISAQKPIASWDSLLAAYSLRPGESHGFNQVYSWMLGGVLPELPSSSDLIQAQLLVQSSLRAELKRTELESVYQSLELPLVEILFAMENHGIRLDRELLTKESKALGQELKILETEIHRLAGSEFNIASPKQLAKVLFENLALTASKKTKTGFSTDNEVLEKIKDEHPIIAHLLLYRELAKLKSTYVDSLPLLVKADGRLHSTFNQALTATGRLSSVDPNLQNIPIKTERGARVRQAFVAEPGEVLLSVDYSQIELRILAHYSEDPNLIRAFQDNLDIHTATASEVFSVALSEVTPEMRRTAKAVNFGIAYGQGAFGLAENLGITRGEAQEIIKRYFARFARVKNYIEDTIASAKERGFVETIYGRRRYMDQLKSSNPMIRKFGERAAVNAPIQGSASDIVKKAMIEIHHEFLVEAKAVTPKMLLQVHDELIFEGTRSVIELWTPRIVKQMESVIRLKVPLKANFAVGLNWDQAH